MSIVIIVIEILLALFFLLSGGQKVIGADSRKRAFKRFGYPMWFLYLNGVVELVGAVGVVAGNFVTSMGELGSVLLAAAMLRAIVSHLWIRDPIKAVIPSSVILVLTLIVGIVYFSI